MPDSIAERKIRVIPATVKYIKRVGIYCRVSTMHESQDESLEIQIKSLEQIVATYAILIYYYCGKSSVADVAAT